MVTVSILGGELVDWYGAIVLCFLGVVGPGVSGKITIVKRCGF